MLEQKHGEATYAQRLALPTVGRVFDPHARCFQIGGGYRTGSRLVNTLAASLYVARFAKSIAERLRDLAGSQRVYALAHREARR
eukprot:6205361-Pleurochrysis_carterae.AAC.2